MQRDGRGGFRQILRAQRHLATIPAWADMQIDVYEAPVSRNPKTTRFGYSFTYTVTELDGTVWTMKVDPEVEEPLAWTEVKSVLPV